MNQVITEGLQLKPPAFAEGLAQWSREDGRPNQDTYANRRVLRNGQLTPDNSPAWDDDFVVATAQWSVNDPRKLTNIANVAQIPVGSLVTGAVGVGREVCVRARDITAGTITLSLPLGVPPQTQSYGFRRFKYLLDFSGFQNLQRFVITDIEFLCADRASAIMLPIDGLVVQVQVEGQARVAASALPEGPLRNSANVVQYVTPYATTRHGVGRGSIRLNWPQPVRGTVQLTARCDTP